MNPECIIKLRKRLGMTQAKFAATIGVSFATVNRWERGHFSPSPLAMDVLKAWDKIKEQEDADIG